MARAGYCKHGLPIDKDRECLYCKSERLDREYKTKAFEDNIRRIVQEELAKKLAPTQPSEEEQR